MLWIRVSRVDKNTDSIYDRTDPHETRFDSLKLLFAELQKTYGRCGGKTYIDTPDGGAQQVGWWFERKEKYTDCDEYFISVTWVSVMTRAPKVITKYFYYDFE